MKERIPPTTVLCTHDVCITCSDTAVPVEVLFVDGDDALCKDEQGNRTEIATELVAPVRKGDTLLAHGGVAIGKVGAESGDRETGRSVPTSGGASRSAPRAHEAATEGSDHPIRQRVQGR